MKLGDLVRYVQNPAPRWKWRRRDDRRGPGILIEEVEMPGTQSRRFKIRWHSGKVTEEWAAYLVPYAKRNEV